VVRARRRRGGVTPQPDTRDGFGLVATRPTAVTSARLGSGSQVRNPLFPKTRSWFALGAPLELLSTLSVLRIVFAVGTIVSGTTALCLPWPDGRRPLAVALGFAVALIWVRLLRVARIEPRSAHVVTSFGISVTLLLTWAGGGGTRWAGAMVFLVWLSVFGALFLGWKRVLGQQVIIFVGSWVALSPSAGVGSAVIDAALSTVGTASVALTILFLAFSARRRGGVDHDTGLPNGFGLAQRLAAVIQSRSMIVAVVLLEGLRDTRDALGYEVGTELLRRVVEDLGQVLPAEAVIGRVSGDELVVALALDVLTPAGEQEGPIAGAQRERDVAEALAATLSGAVRAGRYLVNGIEVSVRPRIGLALSALHGRQVPELVRRASLSASWAGLMGGQHAVWDSSHGAMTEEDLALLSDLRLAPGRGELRLAYQPQFDTRTGRLVSVEALLRWVSPIHGNVSPGRLIPLAERTGLIGRLTNWVLGEALDAQVRWRALGLFVPVSVNLSARSLNDPGLPSWILAELATRNLPPSSLSLELTETAATADLLGAIELLRPLHDCGVRLSIDDFGTGYTSIAALPDLPLDELKVDQRFVRRSPTSPGDEAIVRSVTELAHRLGLQVVAEGVEDAVIMDMMRDCGVDLLQGYHLARPKSEGELLDLLSQHDPRSLPAAPGSPRLVPLRPSASGSTGTVLNVRGPLGG
jgi:EAL domain-containing protein (putative c-di-GMP-specific phosphodiesterase class I)/GGDEF domain-containing protein